jgi:DNA-binding beta-propeller fold protein YncE
MRLEVTCRIENVGAGSWGISFAPDGKIALGTNWMANNVSLLDVANRSILAKLEVGLKPSFSAWSRGGDRVFVTNHFSSEMSVLDLRPGGKRLDVPISRRPMGIAISPDGKLLYAASGVSKTIDVVEADTGRVLRAIPAPVGETNNLGISEDGRTLYATGDRALLLIPTEGEGFLERILLGRDPVGVAVDPLGRWVFVTDYAGQKVEIVDLALRRRVDELLAAAGALFPTVSPLGDRLYVTNSKGDSLSVYNLPAKP